MSERRSEPIDIGGAFAWKPPPLDFVVPGFLAGTVGVLTAPGGSGKSFFALQLCVSVACEAEDGNLLGLDINRHGPTLYLAAEDPELVLWHRLFALGQFLSPEAREAVKTRMTVQSLLGARLDLNNPRHLERLHEVCARGLRLAVIDTLSRCHTVEENNNEQMAELLGGLERISVETGSAILLVHHTGKGESMGDLVMAARGASALVHNARWCGFLAKPTRSEIEQGRDAARHVKFGASKQNYGPPLPEHWYERREGGVLVPVHPTETAPPETATGRTSRKRF
jgi:RecA-family ATPase